MTANRFRCKNLANCGLRAPAQKYGLGDSQAPVSARGGTSGVRGDGRTTQRGGVVPRAASVAGDQARSAGPS